MLNHSNMRYFIWSVIVFVVLVAIAGFFFAGSPKTERLRQFDEQRLGHLQELQWNIVNYWQNKNVLPENLLLLRDDLRGVTVPTDPETGAQYEYMVNGPMNFSLCATFTYPSDTLGYGTDKSIPRPAAPYSNGVSQNWEHDAGRICFDRTIDKDFYKPIKTP